MSVFDDIPDVSQEFFEMYEKRFKNYLFFETQKSGVRKYTCSACGKSFLRGEKVKMRTETALDRELGNAYAGSLYRCPECGEMCEVKNIKRCNVNKLCQNKWVIFVIPKSQNEVWFRGYEIYKKIYENNLKVKFETITNEWYRYKLTPGEARMWKRPYCRDDFYEYVTITDAFTWNHGCEKYDYDICYCTDEGLKGTFLEYNAFSSYTGGNFMKYLSWYAIHPQIEMLVKLGLGRIVDEILTNNRDFKKYINWHAKTPWDMFGLTHQQFNTWAEYYNYNFNVLKIFKLIHGKNDNDFDKANRIINFFSIHSYYSWNSTGMKDIIHVNKIAKQESKTVYDALKYFDKISKNSAGACSHCPGITSHEAYSMWVDYIDMLPTDNKNLPLFPHDLKRRHDEAMRAKNKVLAKRAEKERLSRLKSLTSSAEKDFPKANKVLTEIKEKYEYTGEDFRIIVPENLKELIEESLKLNLCIHTAPTGRYYDRIERNETYILFLRKNSSPKKSYYILEAEPDGTLRQKRTYNDTQNEKDISGFLPFIKEWQAEVLNRLNKKDRKKAEESKRLRNEGFAELRKTKKTINYGEHRGKLLVDVLEDDLLEAKAV